MPVLMVTGYSAERQRARDLVEQVLDMIARPFTLVQIRVAVDDIFDSRPAPEPVAAEGDPAAC